MGQKINPIGLRLGIIKDWNSVWFLDKKTYAKALHEDLKIRKLINAFNFGGESNKKDKKVSAEISKVEILRKPERVVVIINSVRPGVIIGPEGKNIQLLTKEIAKISKSKIEVKIKEIKKPEIDAQIIADNVAKQIKGRFPFRRAMKKSMADAKKFGVGGIRIQVSGRLNGADMARTEWYKEGRVPLHTLRADIDYGVSTAHTTYGATGVKVWVFHNEVLKRDVKDDAGQLIKKSRKQGSDKNSSDDNE